MLPYCIKETEQAGYRSLLLDAAHRSKGQRPLDAAAWRPRLCKGLNLTGEAEILLTPGAMTPKLTCIGYAALCQSLQ